jgi:hypothetical protein
MSKIDTDDFEEKDPFERQRMEAAGEYRRRHQQRQEGEYDELDDGEQEDEVEEVEEAVGGAQVAE